MILKECAKCGALIEYPRRYCAACEEAYKEELESRQAQYKQKNACRYNTKRDPKYKAFYNSSDWKLLSRKYIQDKQYKCEQCGGIAVEVHHKIPIQIPEGWNRRLDYTNLECLCIKCHNERHERFKKRKNRTKREA